MTQDLLTKATALLEAREKMPDEALDMALWDAVNVGGPALKFFSLAANTAPEIITGFQQLLKEKDALIQTLEDENEMLTKSNEHLVQCEGERNDLRKHMRDRLDALEDVTKRFEEAIEGGRREIIGDREAIAKARSFLDEAKAALPPA